MTQYKMMKSKILFTALLMLLGIQAVFAEQRLSLHDCIKIAIEKNINVQQARLEQEKSSYKINETRSSLLPQLDISGTFQDNIQLPAVLVPGDIIGEPGTYVPFTMGTQYNISATISMSQILYNQTALVGLKLSKLDNEISTLGVEKAKEVIAKEMAKLYFVTQTTSEQKKLVQENVNRVDKLTNIVKIQVDNGVGRPVDYDRVKVTLENLLTQLNNIEAIQEQQLNMMKYMLQIPLDNSIVLTDTAAMALLPTTPDPMNDFSNHIDIQLLESQKEITVQSQKLISSGYVPSLVFFGQAGYQGAQNDFGDYFTDNPMNKWYPSATIGLKLSIPVFDGLQKKYKYEQSKVDYTNVMMKLDNTKEHLSVDYRNTLRKYNNNKVNLERQETNIALAKKVYAETELKYREGLANMNDVLQDEMALSNAQVSFLTALYNFKEAEIEIMSLNNQIRNLIK